MQLRHLFMQMIRTETTHGVQVRAVGELIRIVLNGLEFEDVTYRSAVNTLGRYGVRIESDKGKRTGIWLANKWEPLDRLMQTAEFSQGWVNIIKRHPHARQSESALRFAGATSRATFIPREYLPVEEA